MSRFAFIGFEPGLECSKHGHNPTTIGVSRNRYDTGWSRYCEECAADLIRSNLSLLRHAGMGPPHSDTPVTRL